MAEGRWQMSEVRGQKTDDRKQMTEVRRQRSDDPSSLSELPSTLFELRRDKSPRQADAGDLKKKVRS